MAILQEFTVVPYYQLAISQNHDIGILRADIFWGVTVYVLSVGTVAAKFRIPKLADSTYFGL